MSLIDPSDSIERQNEKLLKIADSLMRRVEYGVAHSGAAYAQFERAALLEMQVKERTIDLERTLDLLQEVIADFDGTVLIVSHDRDFLDHYRAPRTRRGHEN